MAGLMVGTLAHHGDVRMIVGQGPTFTHASAAYKGNNSDESGVERLQEKSGGLMVSAHCPGGQLEQTERADPPWHGARRGRSTPVAGRLALIIDETSRARIWGDDHPCGASRQLRDHP